MGPQNSWRHWPGGPCRDSARGPRDLGLGQAQPVPFEGLWGQLPWSVSEQTTEMRSQAEDQADKPCTSHQVLSDMRENRFHMGLQGKGHGALGTGRGYPALQASVDMTAVLPSLSTRTGGPLGSWQGRPHVTTPDRLHRTSSGASELGVHQHRILGILKGSPHFPLEISLATKYPGNLNWGGHEVNP